MIKIKGSSLYYCV